MRRIANSVVAVSLPLLVLGSCARNPATGKMELNMVSEQQEIALGQQTKEETMRTIGDYNNPQAQGLVQKIGKNIAAHSERPNLPWEFHLIDDDQVNAFAAPGGFIFITRGIMAHMNSEAELASVIGHECGHVTARHTARQMTNQQLAQLGLAAGMILSPTVRQLGGQLSQGMQVLFLKFSRDDESQADALGFRYMAKENYDVRAATDMFHTLARVSGAPNQRLPEWESTHPEPENRMANAQHRVDSLVKSGHPIGTLGDDHEAYLQLLDGMRYGPDPQAGYFKGNAFYHPGLKFQFTFPQGWKTANMPDRVVAQSPQGDAVIQLVGAQGKPQDAAKQFFSQQGMQAGNVASTQVNGLPAVQGDFATQMEDGTPVLGAAGFVEYNAHTFALIGFTGMPQNDQQRQQILQNFHQLLGTFKPLTDPALLNVKAAQLKAVRVPRTMTVAEFNKQFPSNVPVEQLAVINGVDGPTATLEGGKLAKQVVGGMTP